MQGRQPFAPLPFQQQQQQQQQYIPLPSQFFPVETQLEGQQRGKRTVVAPVPAAGTKRRKKASKPAAAAQGGDDNQKRTRNPNWRVDEVKTVGDMELLLQFRNLLASI